MKKRYISIIASAALLLAALLTSGCVYDFNPQVAGEGGYMIVDGNIIVGDISTIRLNYSWSLVDSLATQDAERMRILYGSSMRIEDSRGKVYRNSVFDGSGTGWLAGESRTPNGRFDLREADPSLEYRLVIENERGTYATGWAAPLDPGTIDAVTTRKSEDASTLSILVSAHSPGQGGSYYRWTVDETWQYHADVDALYKFVYELNPRGAIINPEIVPMGIGESLFDCWNTSRRTEIMTASTGGLREDRLVDHQLYTLGNRDVRVSVVYHPEVTQTRIPEEAYRYWTTMERNTGDVGGLFSPEPSEYRGNVVNLDNPDELVLGYVGVMRVVHGSTYFDNYNERFYRSWGNNLPEPDTLSTPEEYIQSFKVGWLPSVDVYSETTGLWIGYEWWPARCIDCRMRGGTTVKPAGWPK
ncbi:MAG: DUF4249 domain-containing protein [Bacteroidales bacterium]|nr:DUF4249 domain-containing protein [Bacteroidales bacterium]